MHRGSTSCTQVCGVLGTVTRDEVVPGTAEQQQRKDKGGAHFTHGCRTACRGDAWAIGVWRSARWIGAGVAAAIATTTEEDMKRDPWLPGSIRTVDVYRNSIAFFD
jgi:hypothetical protein